MNAQATEGLVRLSAALARRDLGELREAMEGCVGTADSRAVEEVILQSYLFLGYPIALNAFALWREVSGLDAGEGVEDSWEAWEVRGREVCRTVYGGQYDGLRRNVRALHPDMERWMVAEGYGKVLGRPELDLARRELCIVGLLAVLGSPRQLHSHLRGAMNAGATVGEVEMALSVAGGLMSLEERREAAGVWERVKARRPGRGGRTSGGRAPGGASSGGVRRKSE